MILVRFIKELEDIAEDDCCCATGTAVLCRSCDARNILIEINDQRIEFEERLGGDNVEVG